MFWVIEQGLTLTITVLAIISIETASSMEDWPFFACMEQENQSGSCGF